MPMLTTLRIGLPVYPVQTPLRTRVAKSVMRSSTSCTPGTTFWPSARIEVPRGARKATCSTDRFSETLIRLPRNMASMRPRRPQASASRSSSRTVSSVIRFFE